MNPGQQKAFLSAAVIGALALGGMSAYDTIKIKRLALSSEQLVAEVRGLEASLARLSINAGGVTVASLPGASQAEIANVLRAELGPLSERIAALEVSVSQKSPAHIAPAPSPQAPGQAMLRPAPGNDWEQGEGVYQGHRNLSAVAREKLESALSQNAERVRDQIAAETDPTHPDPSVVQRIIAQSQADMAAELSSILPREDYDALFPPMPGMALGPGASPGTSPKPPSSK